MFYSWDVWLFVQVFKGRMNPASIHASLAIYSVSTNISEIHDLAVRETLLMVTAYFRRCGRKSQVWLQRSIFSFGLAKNTLNRRCCCRCLCLPVLAALRTAHRLNACFKEVSAAVRNVTLLMGHVQFQHCVSSCLFWVASPCTPSWALRASLTVGVPSELAAPECCFARSGVSLETLELP